MNSVRLREMTPADYDDAMALWLGSAGVGRSPDDTPEYLAAFLARNPGCSFVAEANGRLVGAIMAGHDGYRGYIHHTAVAESFRGRGIGRRLTEAALQALGDQGIHKVALVAFESNQGGNAFWESLGFTVRSDLLYRNKRIQNFEEGNPR